MQYCIQKKRPQTQTPNLLSGDCLILPAFSFYHCADGIPTENANSGSLGLFLRIVGLQRDRKFPECELSMLNLLTEKQDLHWDTPALIPPSEV